MNKKSYVLDTSVLISNPNILFELKDSEIFIPIEVLEELDNIKIRMNQAGVSARKVNRFLDEIKKNGSLLSGVTLDSGQTIKVVVLPDGVKMPSGLSDTTDNRVILTSYKLKKKIPDVICLSNDIALRVKCDALGISSEPYNIGTDFAEDKYLGVTTIDVPQAVVDELHEDGSVVIGNTDLYPNQGVLLRSEKSSSLGLVNKNFEIEKLKFTSQKGFNCQGISPRSKEQTIAMELLLDPNVHMVSMVGKAGCGKTLLAIASAMDHLFNKRYSKVIMSRPAQSMSKDIGFLPGTKEEKMAPWLQPIFDNLEVIFSKKGKHYFQSMMEKGQLQIEAMSHVRGRTLPNTIFIIDEAQNITHHEAKAVLTRMGENSKIILIGDLEQIDSPAVGIDTSGLASVVNLFKEFEHSGHVELIKGERSALASYAAKVM